MRINKKVMKRAIKIILSTVLAVLLVNVIANDLLANGFSRFFTISSYKEAFELCEVDIVIINMLRWVLTGISLVIGYAYLSYNAELMKLERGERRAIEYVKRNCNECKEDVHGDWSKTNFERLLLLASRG
jgi:hypothetical protein